jgi:hypothetical protein
MENDRQLFTMKQAARASGMNYPTFYNAVYRRYIIPAPKYRRPKRRQHYYDVAALTDVIATVARLQKAGEI